MGVEGILATVGVIVVLYAAYRGINVVAPTAIPSAIAAIKAKLHRN